jgi:hypothetical protein
MSLVLLEPLLVWGLIPRFVGVLFVLGFGALIPQLDAIIGTRGLVPIAPRLRAAERDFPGLRRFFQFPTLLWINAGDGFIRAIPYLGVVLGLCAIYGGPLQPFALGLAWLLWLSLEPAALIFPWDTMLQEVGFFSLFLPTSLALPSFEASTLPYPAVAFVFRFFVLRLMLGFGKIKFIGSRREDNLYLRGFFVWMPSPTPLAWYGHHLPAWLLRIMLYFMFVAEVIAPMLGFFSGPLRLVSFAILTMLMLGIHASGNWGFFNIGYILLCVCLLDVNSSIFDLEKAPWVDTLWQWPQVGVNALMAVMFITGLLYLVVFDSWTTRTIVHWPLDNFTWKRAWLRALLGYLRAISPFRIVNGYGVFPPAAVPPVRNIPVFEGSNDGVTWKAYKYLHMAFESHDRGQFIAPYQARLDMAICYSIAGVYDASFYGSLIGDGTPYTCYTRSSWLDRLGQRILEGEQTVMKLLGHNPFPDAPPKWIRVSIVALTPSSPEVRRATGAWWHTQRVGVHIPPRMRESWPYDEMVPDPETFHPDWVNYKRRAAPLVRMVEAYKGGMDVNRAVLEGSDLTSADVERFWNEFVPFAREARGDFTQFVARAALLLKQFDRAQIRRFERVLERLAWLLRVRTERQQFADALPKIPIESNFRYHMFLQEMVLDGKEACQKFLADTALVPERFAASSDGNQLWGLALLRSELMMQHVCSFRWTDIGREYYEMKIPGLFEYYPLLKDIVPPDEEFIATVKKLPNGEHVIDGFYPPPTLSPSEAQASSTALG